MASAEQLKKYNFKEEEIEDGIDEKSIVVWSKTGFPESIYRKRINFSIYNQSIEENYFWLRNQFVVQQGYPARDIVKITDVFAATEGSAFFGSSQQRLGAQQDKVSQFLATIGKMVKELFQLVRELRILDERLGYYDDTFDIESKSRESAEITLKGIWIDMVEQGAKNPASVYGMARELEFTTLPDLFFSIHPPKIKDVDDYVDKLEFNRKVKEVLKRKLRTYLGWKESTYHELKNRKIFTLKYLRQHFDIIKMYISWVKPYLRQIRRIEFKDQTKHEEFISAFETAIIEIELLFKKFPKTTKIGVPIEENQHVYSVVVLYVYYRSAPSMNYMQEYQKGPIHVGKTDMTLRGYTWTQAEIDKYIQMKTEEDFELLASVDASVKAAMEALGDELEDYLQQAGEKEQLFMGKLKEEKKKKQKSAAKSVVGGFKEMFGSLAPKKQKGPSKTELEIERERAKKAVTENIWKAYKFYKEKEKMLKW